MNKYYLQSQIRSLEKAYWLWFCFGLHYAYLGKWKLQFLYWISLGGLGIWAIIDLVKLSETIANHNASIFKKIETLNRKERETIHIKNLKLINTL